MWIRILTVVFIVSLPWFGAVEVSKAQFTTLDFDVHNVGLVQQLVTNQGNWDERFTNYGGLMNAEYPPGSFQEHLLATGFYIGGITPSGDTLVSASRMFGAARVFQGYSSARWDTVYEVLPGDTVDIGAPSDPYMENYTPVSDQDFVTRMNDYNKAAIQKPDHNPLYVDVIQTSYAWSSAPLNDIIVFNFNVISKRYDLRNVYVGMFVDAGVGRKTAVREYAFSSDDRNTRFPAHNMVISTDAAGGPDGGKYTPVGIRLFPSQSKKRTPTDSLTWTWIWGPRFPIVPPPRDQGRYEQMSSGTIRENMTRAGSPHYIHTFGPYDLNKGDTLRWSFAEIMGKNSEMVLQNSKLVERLYPEFRVPSPPPAPEVRVETRSRKVILSWGHKAEDYTDPHRSDSVKKAFEGYRVYKSTQTASGPWTLLADYDIPDNSFGQNTGLKHKYVDTGLLNNVEYFYAVTAYSKPDTVLNFPSQESSRRSNALSITPGPAPPDSVGKVAVVPNPYRGDINYHAMNPPWEKPPPGRERWLEQDRRIQFINLPARCTIKIYTLSGRVVETIEHSNPNKGFEDWNLTSDVNQAVASGIYLFTVKNHRTGNTQTGKFVIIK